MSLSFANGRYAIDGDPATEESVVVARDNQIDLWAEELRQLAIDELGDGEAVTAVEFPLGHVAAFGARFLGRIAETLVGAYTWARGGPDLMTDTDYANVAEMVDEQDEYGQGFVTALQRGELSPAQAANRASMYAHAATKAFEMGKGVLRGFPEFPAYPGEACEGRSLCRCFWSTEETDEEYRMTWHAVGDEQICGWCSGNASRYRPYTVPK